MYPGNLVHVGAQVGRGGRLGHLVAEVQIGCSGGTLWDVWDTRLQGLRQDNPIRLIEEIMAEETTCPTAAKALDAASEGVHMSPKC
jgi:hypothetical protein